MNAPAICLEPRRHRRPRKPVLSGTVFPYREYRAARHCKSSPTIQRESYEDARLHTFQVTFGNRLKQARQASHLSGAALGEALGGLSRQTINHWEMGRVEPTVSQIVALCDKLRINADWLLRGPSAVAWSLPTDQTEVIGSTDATVTAARKKGKHDRNQN